MVRAGEGEENEKKHKAASFGKTNDYRQEKAPLVTLNLAPAASNRGCKAHTTEEQNLVCGMSGGAKVSPPDPCF